MKVEIIYKKTYFDLELELNKYLKESYKRNQIRDIKFTATDKYQAAYILYDD